MIFLAAKELEKKNAANMSTRHASANIRELFAPIRTALTVVLNCEQRVVACNE